MLISERVLNHNLDDLVKVSTNILYLEASSVWKYFKRLLTNCTFSSGSPFSLYSLNLWGFFNGFSILLSKIRADRGCSCGFIVGGFSIWSCRGARLHRSPLGIWGGVWCFLLFWWSYDFKALSIWDAIDLGTTTWLLFERASYAVFPLWGALCRISSRKINLYSMLFKKSLAPSNMRLTCNSWKSDNVSSFEAGSVSGGLDMGIIIDNAICRGWSRSGCNKVSTPTWLVIAWGWGGESWVLTIWEAVAFPRTEKYGKVWETRVWKIRKSRLICYSNRSNAVDLVLTLRTLIW